MSELVASGFGEFDRLALLYRRTLRVLDLVSATGELPAEGPQMLAAEALPHVEDMEAGFRVWLRASHADVAELRAMVARAGVAADAQSPAEQRAALIERMQAMSNGAQVDLAPAPARYIAALELARLVFALLPATPASEVHYPLGLRSYADISPPHGPAELVARIEELERGLWRVAAGRPPQLTDSGYRRTYGFFDAAARLVGRGFMLS